MSAHQIIPKKFVSGSIYHYVKKYIYYNGKIKFFACLPGFGKGYDDERKCALAVDRKLIDRGNSP